MAGSISRKSKAGDSQTSKSQYGSKSVALGKSTDRMKTPAKTALGHYYDKKEMNTQDVFTKHRNSGD